MLDTVRSKATSPIEHAGFSLNLTPPPNAQSILLNIDMDYFIQIMINLIDNALKFAAKADNKGIDIACRIQTGSIKKGQYAVFTVRDYGPGIRNAPMKKIFTLFYRAENELTRETIGTGIGLALVQQLVLSMHGKVDAVNVQPGVEFSVSLPIG